jgi:hypothetical protein
VVVLTGVLFKDFRLSFLSRYFIFSEEYSVVRIIGCLVTLGLMMAALSGQEKKGPTPHELPDAQAQAKAEKTIKEVFKAEYAKKKAVDQIDLAQKLLAQGKETNDDPAAKFVLFREARDLASRAGDVDLAMHAVDQLVRHYRVRPLDMKIAAFEQLDKAVLTATAARSVFEGAMACVEESLPLDDYDLAIKFLKIAQSAGGKTKVAANSALAGSRLQDVENIRKEHDKVKAAIGLLKEAPDNPDANLQVGQFLCFMKGDWAAGLPLLAKTTDAKIKALALKDLDAPKDAAGRVELADSWWELAEGLPKFEKTEVRLRAVTWYKQALGDLTGLTKTRVEQRIAEMAPVAAARTNPTAAQSSDWLVLFHSDDPSIWNTEVKKGNSFAVKLSTAPDKTRYLKLTDTAKKRTVIIEITKEKLGQRVETNGYGWNGTCKNENGAHSLGIYNPAWSDLNIGDTFIFSPGFLEGVRGWGFGAVFANNKQGWSWQGVNLVSTVFEISVKAGDLTAEEAKLLLKKKEK